MPEVTEQIVCKACDASVRENTVYCYNCGSKLDLEIELATNGTVAVADDNSKAALDELADKLSHGSESDSDLAKAATKRKKARVMHRKRNEFSWEPREDSAMLAVFFSAFVAFVALVVVILLVIWR